jgi:hypothetical protein
MNTPLTTSSAVNYNRLLDATAGGVGPTWHAKLGLDSGATMAARIGANGSWQLPAGLHFNAPTLLDDLDSRSVFFSRGQSYGTVTSPLASASFTADMALQLTGVAAKHILLTRDENVREAGRFSVEIVADEAGGMRPRVFSRDGGGSPVVLIGTNPATVPLGVPCKFTYVRDSANGSQKVYVNGQEIALTLASGSMPTSWAAVPGGTWAIGMWPIGDQAGFEGLIAEVALWSSALALPDIQSLVVPAALPAIHLSDVTAGDVVAHQLKQISLAHATAPAGLSPTIIAQGVRGVASTSGTDVSYQAGATTGSDSFEIQGSKDGRQSRVALFNINILSAPSAGDEDWMDARRDSFWNGQGYSTVWSHTPEGVDVGVDYTTYLNKWYNGQPHFNTNFRSKQGTLTIVDGPGNIPAIRAFLLQKTVGAPGAGDALFQTRGSQLTQSSPYNHAVYSAEVYFEAIKSNGQNGLYFGFGRVWGSAPGVTFAPGGSTSSSNSWSARVPCTQDLRYLSYLYPVNHTGSGMALSTPHNPALGQWILVEHEITTTDVRLFINGTQLRNDSVAMRGSDTSIKHKGHGMGFKHNNGAPINETIFMRRWKIRAKV